MVHEEFILQIIYAIEMGAPFQTGRSIPNVMEAASKWRLHFVVVTYTSSYHQTTESLPGTTAAELPITNLERCRHLIISS